MRRALLALFAAVVFSPSCGSPPLAAPDAGSSVCLDDDGCALDAICADGTCVPGTGNACEPGGAGCGIDEVCLEVLDCGAARCHGNTCAPRTCTEHDQCERRWCSGGQCLPPPSCSAGEACPADFVCEGGVCVLHPALACSTDQGCAAPEVCVGGVCGAPRSCRMSATCGRDERCVLGLCRDPCDDDATDCGFGRCNHARGECENFCTADGECRAGGICQRFVCVGAECALDSECPETGVESECQGDEAGHGRCVDVVFCADDGSCPPGRACDDATQRCEPRIGCASDRACAAAQYCQNGFCVDTTLCTASSCDATHQCVGGRCVPKLCRGRDDCPPGERCAHGACGALPSPETSARVRILTPAIALRSGETYSLEAVALDAEGGLISGIPFEWASEAPEVVEVSRDGLARAGSRPGVSAITARLVFGDRTLISPPLELRTLDPLEADVVRVVVVAERGGAVVTGAAVEIRGDFGVRNATTDLDGVARLPNVPVGAVFTVTAAHPLFDYLSVLELDVRDVQLALPPLTTRALAAGYRSTANTSALPRRGNLALTFSGASIAPPFLGFDPAVAFGGQHFSVDVLSPEGGTGRVRITQTFTVTFLQDGGGEYQLKETAYVPATPGLRATWTFGAIVDRRTLQASQLGGSPDFGRNLLDAFREFRHGLGPFLDLSASPTIVDSANIDGDDDTTELVPNWAALEAVRTRPDTEPSLRLHIRAPALPIVSGGRANAILAFAGVVLPEIGFVPLGIDAHVPNLGAESEFTMAFAPPRAGLETGEYMVLVTALRMGRGGDVARPGASRIFFARQLPAELDFRDGWLDASAGSTFFPLSRELALDFGPEADAQRVLFRTSVGGWHVYGPAPSVGARVFVPLAPAGLADRTEGAELFVDTVDFWPGQALGDLFRAGSATSLRFDRAVRAFAHEEPLR